MSDDILSAKILSQYFGAKSVYYQEFTENVIPLIDSEAIYYQSWKDTMILHYGELIDEDLYVAQLYLVYLSRIILNFLVDNKEAAPFDTNGLIGGLNLQKTNLSFLSSSEIGFNPMSFLNITSIHEFMTGREIEKEDLFIELYQEIIQVNNRINTGEYYTPNWTTQYLINTNLKDTMNPELFVLDPGCGTGVFLINYMYELVSYIDDITPEALTTHIHGFDINPISIYLARCNYIIALQQLFPNCIQKKSLPNPLFVKNSLLEGKKHSNDKQSGYLGGITEVKQFNRKYDRLIGNPPWIVMRNIEDTDYRNYLKQLSYEYGILSANDTDLFSQLELAAIFFNRTIDVYLKTAGKFLLIMPKSVIMGTKHLERFRQFNNPDVELTSILDLYQVKSLFRMPACVLIGNKGTSTVFPVDLVEIKHPSESIESVSDFTQNMEDVHKKYSPPPVLEIKSHYHDKLNVGACIFPKALFFVSIIEESENGKLLVRTNPSLRTSKKWDVNIRGFVNEENLYTTLETVNLYPFYFTSVSTIALPVTIENNQPVLHNKQNIDQLQKNQWFKQVYTIYDEKHTNSARISSLSDRLNYNSDLVKQDLSKRYLFVYGATGKHTKGVVIDKKEIAVDERKFVVDVKLWYYATNNLDEAHYLCGLVNSKITNQAIKRYQAQGKGGARAIHRLPFELPFPQFDPKYSTHIEIVKISKQAHSLMRNKFNDVKVTRKKAKHLLRTTYGQLDKLVYELLPDSHPILQFPEVKKLVNHIIH